MVESTFSSVSPVAARNVASPVVPLSTSDSSPRLVPEFLVVGIFLPAREINRHRGVSGSTGGQKRIAVAAADGFYAAIKSGSESVLE